MQMAVYRGPLHPYILPLSCLYSASSSYRKGKADWRQRPAGRGPGKGRKFAINQVEQRRGTCRFARHCRGRVALMMRDPDGCQQLRPGALKLAGLTDIWCGDRALHYRMFRRIPACPTPTRCHQHPLSDIESLLGITKQEGETAPTWAPLS